MRKNSQKITNFIFLTAVFGLFYYLPAKALTYPPIFGINPLDSAADFIKYIYFFGASTMGVIAIASLTYAGTQYVLSAAKPGLRSLAKERILETLIGLGLVFGASTLFYTINPALVALSPDILGPSPAAPSLEGPPTSIPLGEITLFPEETPSAPPTPPPAPTFLPPPTFAPSLPPPTIPPPTTPLPTIEILETDLDLISSLGSDLAEQCDGSDFGANEDGTPITASQLCLGFGYSGGTVSCLNCQLDLSGCSGYTPPEDPLPSPSSCNNNGIKESGGGTPTFEALDPMFVESMTSTYLASASELGLLPATLAAEFTIEENAEPGWDKIVETNIYCPHAGVVSCEDLINDTGVFQNIDFLALLRLMNGASGKIYIQDSMNGCADCNIYSAHFVFEGVPDADRNAFLQFFYDNKTVFYTTPPFPYQSGCTGKLLTTAASGETLCADISTCGSSCPSPACPTDYCEYSYPNGTVKATPNSITLAWQPPPDQSSPYTLWKVTGYTLTRSDMSDFFVNVPDFHYTISGLLPNTTYNFIVTASFEIESFTGVIEVLNVAATTTSSGESPAGPFLQCVAPRYCYETGITGPLSNILGSCSTHPSPASPVHFTLAGQCVVP